MSGAFYDIPEREIGAKRIRHTYRKTIARKHDCIVSKNRSQLERNKITCEDTICMKVKKRKTG